MLSTSNSKQLVDKYMNTDNLTLRSKCYFFVKCEFATNIILNYFMNGCVMFKPTDPGSK